MQSMASKKKRGIVTVGPGPSECRLDKRQIILESCALDGGENVHWVRGGQNMRVPIRVLQTD